MQRVARERRAASAPGPARPGSAGAGAPVLRCPSTQGEEPPLAEATGMRQRTCSRGLGATKGVSFSHPLVWQALSNCPCDDERHRIAGSPMTRSRPEALPQEPHAHVRGVSCLPPMRQQQAQANASGPVARVIDQESALGGCRSTGGFATGVVDQQGTLGGWHSTGGFVTGVIGGEGALGSAYRTRR